MEIIAAFTGLFIGLFFGLIIGINMGYAWGKQFMKDRFDYNRRAWPYSPSYWLD